jgi:hypothetical protein
LKRISGARPFDFLFLIYSNPVMDAPPRLLRLETLLRQRNPQTAALGTSQPTF